MTLGHEIGWVCLLQSSLLAAWASEAGYIPTLLSQREASGGFSCALIVYFCITNTSHSLVA